MRRARSARAGGIIAVVIAVIIGLGVSCNGFREDEIECEKAAVHLRECCPRASASTLDCSYHESLDCNDSVVAREYPALSIEDSECLRKKSCAQMIADEDCVRASTAKQRVTAVDASASPKPQARVCKD